MEVLNEDQMVCDSAVTNLDRVRHRASLCLEDRTMISPRKDRHIDQDGEYLDMLDSQEQYSLETELTVY